MSLSDAVMPAVITGAIAGVGSTYVMGSSINNVITLAGIDVSAPVAYGTVAAISKGVNHLTRDSILPYFNSSGFMVGMTGLASPIITGVSMIVVASLLEQSIPTTNAAMRLFVLGGVSDAIGDYVGQYLGMI